MSELSIFRGILAIWFALTVVVGAVLLLMPAPYGRHASRGWGPSLPARYGWILMEIPAVVVMAACYAVAPPTSTVAWVFLGIWQLHYVHRAVIFPWRLHSQAKGMPWSVALMGFTFNCLNAYLNGRWLTHFGAPNDAWMQDPRFLLGVAVFVAGMCINLQSDQILLRLRRQRDVGYSIPLGGLFRLVSCPNYLGEAIEWTGWAIAVWALPSTAFALWTFANLMPRAIAHHRWYRRTFADYPRERRAFLPGLI